MGTSWCVTAAQGHPDALIPLLDEVWIGDVQSEGDEGPLEDCAWHLQLAAAVHQAPGPSLMTLIGFGMNGSTLHSACYGRLPCVQLLIERGACDVNMQHLHTTRMTPLMCCRQWARRGCGCFARCGRRPKPQGQAEAHCGEMGRGIWTRGAGAEASGTHVPDSQERREEVPGDASGR